MISMIMNNQKGISLIVTFLIMTIMLVIVLGISTILFHKIKIINDLENSASSFNSAFSGMEKTLYFDKKQVPNGAKRGFCNICNACADCNSCTLTPLAPNGCNITNCVNCQLTYSSTFDNRSYNIDAKVTPNILSPTVSDFYINAQGFYNNTTRTIVKLIKPGYLKIIKNSGNQNGTFNYTISGLTPLTTSITTSGGTGSVTQAVSADDAGTTYTITETVSQGWTFRQAICNKSYTNTVNGVTNVMVLADETTMCTFSNQKGAMPPNPPPPPPPSPFCGDGTCTAGSESCVTCSVDCGICPSPPPPPP